MIIPFEPEHAVQIHLSDEHPYPRQYLGRVREWAEQVHSHGPSATLVRDDGLLLASFGMLVIKPGVAEAWLVLSDEMVKEGTGIRDLIRELRFRIDYHMMDLKIHRLGAWARVDFPKAHRLIGLLGFEKEGVMRKYDVDGTDAVLYSIVRGG